MLNQISLFTAFGNIFIESNDDESGKPKKIGEMSLVIFDLVGGMNAGFNPFDVIDSRDQTSADYGQIIFDGDGNINKHVQRRFPEAFFIGRVLVLG